MPELVLGPLLRYVGEECATFWVETDSPCEVSVLGTTERTFHVEGHHFGLVRVRGLETGAELEYTVELDGEQVWPLEGSAFPPSRFRTSPKSDRMKLAFGSCRTAMPNSPPFTLTKDQDERGRELDALRGLAFRMKDQPFEEWPDLLLLLGDQVYADEVSPETEKFVRSQRDMDEDPGKLALNYEEYTHLYQEAWSEPVMRWLLSTVSSAMIFDDHDIHDDWNTSQAWLDEMRASDWWDEHIVGGLMSYWIYQHAGNISPSDQDEDELFIKVREAEDAGPLLREYALKADREKNATRWSYCRDLGDTRLVVIDSRCGRMLEEGSRDMLDEDEWLWIENRCTGDFDHLLIATTLPWLLSPAMHHVEAWNEKVCGGAWGSRAAKVGEKIRQGLDLEHWGAFNRSFDRLAELQRRVAAGELGTPPASIVTLSGDVHHAYLSEVAYPRGSGVQSNVYQAVCSPLRNPLDDKERRVINFMMTKPAFAIARALSRAAGVESEPVRWRMVGEGPFFDNQVASLELEGRSLDFRIEKAEHDDDDVNGPGEPKLECVFEHKIA
ncbi:MAG: alkaline phosphatase D family protein [Thermoleophilaceae bacterium]